MNNFYETTPKWSQSQHAQNQSPQNQSTELNNAMHTHSIPNIGWVILSGGESKRMDGDDKGLLQHGDRRLIEHVLTKLENQGAHPIYINANRNQEQYQQLAPVFGDIKVEGSEDAYHGPLLGFYTGLTQLSHEWLGFVPCDAPNLSKNIVVRFTQACAELSKNQPEIDLFVADDGTNFQPVFCMINRRIASTIKEQLDNKNYKIADLYPKITVMKIDFSDKPSAFNNLNYKDQLEV